MLKGLGYMLIFLSSSGIGFASSRQLKNHLKELEELKKIFCLLKSELQYTHAPFAEVFRKLSQKVEGVYQVWLFGLSENLTYKTGQSFQAIWDLSILTYLQESRLKAEELQDLKRIGNQLEYVESLSGYIEQLEYRIHHTREEYRLKYKLYRSMGIMGGAFLVILLL